MCNHSSIPVAPSQKESLPIVTQIEPSALSPDRPVLIAGPTASGKSALALEIAKTRGGPIVNADASQVFEGWRILTARPSAAEETTAAHALYGHVPFEAAYSVGDWLRDVRPLLTRRPKPIIVGGTGLYFTALTRGLAEIPETPAELRAQADRHRIGGDLRKMIDDLDTETARRIDLQNPMRVQRAWEVQMSTGRGLAVWQDDTPPPLLDLGTADAFVLDAQKDWLNERISRRFDIMLDTGALEEAKANLHRFDPGLLSCKAIGAPELTAYLRGEIPLDAARDAATIATRQFAKRQRTWFRAKMRDWTWLTC